MRAMTYKLLASLKKHRWIPAVTVLLVFILPIFHVLMFFWPLLVSTALGVLAVVSVRQQTEKQHRSEIVERGIVVESSQHADLTSVPPFEEKIGNVLMAGGQEVTWLEWLHYEDTHKLCVQEGQESAAWDTCEYDLSALISKERGDAPASTGANGKLNTVSSDGSIIHKDEASNHVSTFAEEENRPDMPIGHVLTEEDGTRTTVNASMAPNGLGNTAIINNVLSQDKLKVNAAMVSAPDDGMDVDLTVDDCTCGFGSTRRDAIARHAVNCKGIALPVNEPYDASVSVCPREKDASGLPCVVKMPSLPDMERAEIVERDEGEKDLKQLVKQGPQWDASDGEEDQSSLWFSFFHDTCSKA